MKTANDVLSFEDITQHNDLLGGEMLENYKEEAERFIHTFLEWNLYNKYIYHLGWSLEYVSTSQGNCDPIIMNTRVDTLQEAELMAMKKVGRFLGTQVHLEQNNTRDDSLYKVIDKIGAYRGMVKIQHTG